MKPIRFIILLLCASPLFVGCQQNTENAHTLDSVEEIIEDNPDSAFLMLQDIDVSALRGGDAAKYNILMNYALYKNNCEMQNESSIEVALNYYSKRRDTHQLMLATFLAAEYARQNGNPTESLEKMLDAYELARKCNDDFWLGKTARQLSILYSHDYNYEEVSRYAEKAVSHFLKAGKERYRLFALADYADAQYTLGNKTRGEELLDSIRIVSIRDDPDTVLLTYVLSLQQQIYLERGDHNRLLANHEKLVELKGPDAMSVEDLVFAARSYCANGDYAKTSETLKLAEKLTEDSSVKGVVYQGWSEFFQAIGDYKSAKSCADSVIYYIDLESRMALQSSMLAQERDRLERNAEKEAHKSAIRKLCYIFGSFVLVIVFALIWFIYRLKVRKKRLELEVKIRSLMDDITSQNIEWEEKTEILNSRILETQNRMHETESRVQETQTRMRETRTFLKDTCTTLWKQIDTMCGNFRKNGEGYSKNTPLSLQLAEDVKSFCTSETLGMIERGVNENFDGLVDALRVDFPRMKETNIIIFCLSVAGFSLPSISLLMKISIDNAYKKRSRLREMIQKSNLPNKERYLSLLPLTRKYERSQVSVQKQKD